MHKILIQKAFKKAKEERIKIGENIPSLTKKAEDLSDYISTECNYNIGEMRLRQYYNQAVNLNTEMTDINISQLEVVNGLCNYLEFETYEDFKGSLSHEKIIKRTSNKGKENTVNIWIKKKKIIIAFGILIFTFFIIKTILNKERWMVWEQDHYTEVLLDLKKYNINQLKEYDKKLMLSFKKINSPNCNTEFYTENGKVKVWYLKKNNEEIEVYSTFGLHPITGKTLKPITKHMIEKYICTD